MSKTNGKLDEILKTISDPNPDGQGGRIKNVAEAKQAIEAYIKEKENKARIDELEELTKRIEVQWVVRGETMSHETFVHSNLIADRIAELKGGNKDE